MLLKKMWITSILSFSLIIIPRPAYAVWGDGGAGWANAAYLAKILTQSLKRYYQLKVMISDIKGQKNLLKAIHRGIENSVGILETLPIKDQRILEDIRNFKHAFKTVTEVYGAIPKSPEEFLHRLHDETVAESLRMVRDFKRYAKREEENAKMLMIQSRSASPKGASRMAVQSNASILGAISQLIRLNNQTLKMQSEILAIQNRESKKSASSHQEVYQNFGSGFRSFKPANRMPRI